MGSLVCDLANLIRTKQQQGAQKFVLMLGAGASLASGMPFTNQLKSDLLREFGSGTTGGDVDERFDRMWEETTPANRNIMLQIYFKDLQPSPGYHHLAQLIKEGCFDIVITLNFDNVLEAALDLAGVSDKAVIVGGDFTDSAFVRSVEDPLPRVKILKLHGSARSANTFLFTREEMLDYPEEVRMLVGNLTRRDIIMCGYGFDDLCMKRAFSLKGESIWCVNPAGAPIELRPVMKKRQSENKVVEKDEGSFDNFFTALAGELHREAPRADKPVANPFKFLEGYRPQDRDWFVLRRKLTRKLVRRLETQPPRTIHLIGPQRSGKTSFVRAGLLPWLAASRTPFRSIYLRCRANLESWLAVELARHIGGNLEGRELPDLLGALVTPDSRVVLVLDQFERVVRSFPETAAGRQQLRQWIERLDRSTPDGVTVLCVGPSTDSNYLIVLNQLGAVNELIDPFEPRHVRRMIGALSRKAGIVFEREAVEAVVKKYADTQGTRRPFTLTHVQALCHLLCTSSRIDVSAVERVEREELNSLDLVLNEYDLFGLMEDVPFESQQSVLRQVTKFIADPGRQKLAFCLQQKFSEIFAESAAGSGK
jgi:hypothetical protein